jgi:hypothetical protein
MDDIYGLLEDYLDGKLSEADRQKVETRIASEEEVAAQLEMLRLERELGSLLLEDKLQAKMDSWAAEKTAHRQATGNGQGEPGEAEKQRDRRWWIPMLLVLFIGLAYWYLSPEPPSDNKVPPGQTGLDPAPMDTVTNQPAVVPEGSGQQGLEEIAPDAPDRTASPDRNQPQGKTTSPPIAEQDTDEDYAQPLAMALADTRPVTDIDFGTKSVNSTEGETAFEKGYRLMGEGMLEEALPVLQSIPEEEKGLYLNARQYVAYILFEQKNYTEAKPILEELLDIGYAEESKMQWLLALSYLATNEQQRGLELIERLANQSGRGVYKSRAQHFLEQ